MSELLVKLVDFVVLWIGALLPWYILPDDEIGLVRRFGRYHRDLRTGWNWKWPVIEQTLSETSALDSEALGEQTLTTADGHQVILSVVIAYRVANARKYLLECATAVSVLNDVGSCVMSEVVPMLTIDEVLHQNDLQIASLLLMRQRARKWGITVESVGFADRAKTRTYRLITG